MELHENDCHTAALIGCLTYQSRAAHPPSDAELDTLVAEARARNHSVGVTGMLLYEDGRYLQTLEGPPDQLDAIWTSIRSDERHADIEVLTEHLVSARLFSQWDLLHYRRSGQAPKGLLDRLRRKHPLSAHIKTLTRLALEADEQALNEMFARLAEKGWTGDVIVEQLLEPAARAMGDAWLADECSEFDLTLGLGMLQSAGHAVRYRTDAEALRNTRHTILLVSAPGEPHISGPSLLADQFTDAGWAVEMAFPETDEALANQLSAQQPEAVDIALSEALPRYTKLSTLRESVKRVRWSTAGQPLVISVGGRLFAEATATAEHVGADHARKSMAGARVRIAELVERPRRRD
jgi:methanogenic corrinoid protein MtbC1